MRTSRTRRRFIRRTRSAHSGHTNFKPNTYNNLKSILGVIGNLHLSGEAIAKKQQQTNKKHSCFLYLPVSSIANVSQTMLIYFHVCKRNNRPLTCSDVMRGRCNQNTLQVSGQTHICLTASATSTQANDDVRHAKF